MSLKKMAFIAHWVENWNWLWWFGADITTAPRNSVFTAPLCSLASAAYLYGPKSFDLVDHFHYGKNIECRTILLRNFAEHFHQPKNHARIRKNLLSAVVSAQEESDAIGLGALTKAEWLTNGGEWIVRELGAQLKVPIVHGDTLTSAVVFQQAVHLLERFGIGPVYITGGTSKIGRAVALSLARLEVPVRMYTQSQERYEHIQKEAKECGKYISHSRSLSDARECTLWITGKAKPTGKEMISASGNAPPVLNFSVPNPMRNVDFDEQQTLSVFEGGLLNYDPAHVNIRHTMRLPYGFAYSCHVGAIVHAYNGWKHHETGPVDVDSMSGVLHAAEEIGFSVPKFK